MGGKTHNVAFQPDLQQLLQNKLHVFAGHFTEALVSVICLRLIEGLNDESENFQGSFVSGLKFPSYFFNQWEVKARTMVTGAYGFSRAWQCGDGPVKIDSKAPASGSKNRL